MRDREVVKKFKALGCREIARTGDGSHRTWLNPANGALASLPDRGGDDLKLGTLRASIRDLGLSWDEFQKA